jgi:hypothetical protein
MRWSEIPIKALPNTLRGFAVLWVFVFGGLASWQFLQDHKGLAAIFLVLALLLGPLGLLWPGAIRPVYIGMIVLAFPLNWFFTRLVLALVYYCLVTPLGLCLRLFGREGLAWSFRPEKETYWVHKPGARNVRDYFRQS